MAKPGLTEPSARCFRSEPRLRVPPSMLALVGRRLVVRSTVPTEEIAPSTCSFFENCSASKIGARLPSGYQLWTPFGVSAKQDSSRNNVHSQPSSACKRDHMTRFCLCSSVTELHKQNRVMLTACQLKLSPQFAELEVQLPVNNSAHGTIGHRLVRGSLAPAISQWSSTTNARDVEPGQIVEIVSLPACFACFRVFMIDHVSTVTFTLSLATKR